MLPFSEKEARTWHPKIPQPWRQTGFAYENSQNMTWKPCFQYSYKEQWQPKDIPVIFRMYQLNLDGRKDRVYRKYWDAYEEHFVEMYLM